MLLGIVLFAACMTLATSTDRFYALSRKTFVRRTLYAGYGIRVAMTIVAPIGFYIDVYPGLLSIDIVEAIAPNWMRPNGFAATLLITLLQGTILNLMVSAFMLVAWGAQRGVLTPTPRLETSCAACRYNLQETPAGAPCPECGSTKGTFDFDRTLLSRSPAWLSWIVFVVTVVGLAILYALG